MDFKTIFDFVYNQLGWAGFLGGLAGLGFGFWMNESCSITNCDYDLPFMFAVIGVLLGAGLKHVIEKFDL
ncbi:MAG TPA: hypothetical protein VF434_15795 [Promineifilum sp.]